MADLISRRAAINALEHKKDKNAKGDMARFYNTIIQNDIDALMQLPRAQAKPTFEQVKEYCERRCLTVIANEFYHDLITACSEKPERKKGEWIGQDQGAFYTIECSECHKEPLLDEYGDYVYSDFCPVCGADMRGGKNGRTEI